MARKIEIPSELESEEKLNELADKMKLDKTVPQSLVLGWRSCFDWMKSKLSDTETKDQGNF